MGRFDTGDAEAEGRSLALTIDNLELREDVDPDVIREKERLMERLNAYAVQFSSSVSDDIKVTNTDHKVFNLDDFFADMKPLLVKHVKDANPMFNLFPTLKVVVVLITNITKNLGTLIVPFQKNYLKISKK